ncbi:type II secretion system F family protein [Exiguobacterium flavidum]|uniref:type II secretion system F family protein n=1 Tax=Exiguobacterium flavidum TaxID=2184695 RepID=UPI001E2931DD|nr:type II secretion system F family protein [Exiguobacterium flavidum]
MHRRAITISHQTRFLKRFIRLVEQGISVKETLRILKNYEASSLLLVIEQMELEFEVGASFSDAFKPLRLPESLENLIAVGDRTDRPLPSLRQVVRLLELGDGAKKRFRKVTRYPFLLCVSLLMLFIFYAIYVLPSLLALSTPGTLGLFRILLDPAYRYAIAFAPVLFTLSALLLVKKLPINTLLRIKPVHSVVSLYWTYLFTLEVGSFVQAGFSLEETFSSLKDNHTGETGRMYKVLHERQYKGERLTEAMAAEAYIDFETIGLVHLATEGGDLGNLLLEQTELLHEKIEEMIERMLAWFEPLLYGVLTVVTGGLFFILYYPIQLAIKDLPF